MVTWTRGPDVYARIYDASAAPLTPQFMISDAGSSDSGPVATLLANGRIVLNWTTNANPTFDPYGNVDVGKVLELVRTVTGDASADSYASTALDHTRDLVSGAKGADSLSTGYGADTINGEGGNDLLEGGNDSDLLSGGLGRDRIYGASKASPDGLYPAADTISGDAGDDALYGGSGGDSISGGDDEDLLSGRGGADRMAGDLGEDTLFGGDGDDTLQGGLDGDRLAGGAGNDLIFGMTEADPDGSTVGDTATGGAGNDLIRGSAGGDDLAGNGGRDTLTGGAGTDTLEGGLQADRFVYLAASDSTYDTGPDRITDLNDIDRIDLSAIDANPFEAGDQKFKLVSDLTGHPGQLRVTFLTAGPYAGSTAILGDVNGDGSPDFFIVADGNHAGYDNFIY
jgi:Ca2+-binding RTX toxin-like protein